MSKFWFVWHEAHGLPRHKHLTMNEAFKEAERLARENRGKHFHSSGHAETGGGR